MTFLIIALAIGLFQVLLGLGLGVYNGIKTKHWSHVYEKGGIFAFVVGFIALVLDGRLRGGPDGELGRRRLLLQALAALLLFLGLIFAIKGGGDQWRDRVDRRSRTSRATCESWPSASPAPSSPRRSTRSPLRWATRPG